MATPDPDTLLETIVRLANEIGRAAPECAEKAEQIVALAADIGCSRIDRATIRDAIESGTADTDISDGQVRSTTEAVVRAVREPS